MKDEIQWKESENESIIYFGIVKASVIYSNGWFWSIGDGRYKLSYIQSRDEAKKQALQELRNHLQTINAQIERLM